MNLLKKTSLLICFSALLYNLISQYLITSKYSEAQDKRLELLIDLNKKMNVDTTIILAPLPKSGMVYSTEITADTNHFRNKVLRLGYNLKFHVAVNR